jgi:hypothetical protein
MSLNRMDAREKGTYDSFSYDFIFDITDSISKTEKKE